MSFQAIKPSNDDEWLELRSKVLTATEVSVILGLNKWQSVKDVLENKKEIKKIDNAYIQMGHWLEPLVVQATNKVIGTNFNLMDRSFYVDYDIKLGATPDAWQEGELLECKTTKPRNFYKWSDWPPAYYLMQLYTQLVCTELQTGYLAVMSTNLTQFQEELKVPIAIFKLERHERIDNILKAEVKRFWETCEEGKVYRVNRKQASILDMLLRIQTRKIYGT